MNLRIDQEKDFLLDAAVEAIYWWERDEAYYHSYFRRINELKKDPDIWNHFMIKIFDVFLSEYSIRRNIRKDKEGVDTFINVLVDLEFFEHVMDGSITKLIDTTSKLLKDHPDTLNKEIKSLLSKIAFLMNPYYFCLSDRLSRNSLHRVLNEMFEERTTHKFLYNYENYHRKFHEVVERFKERGYFEATDSFLKECIPDYIEHQFYKNRELYRLRIVDKYLWLLSQPKERRKTEWKKFPYFIS